MGTVSGFPLEDIKANKPGNVTSWTFDNFPTGFRKSFQARLPQICIIFFRRRISQCKTQIYRLPHNEYHLRKYCELIYLLFNFHAGRKNAKFSDSLSVHEAEVNNTENNLPALFISHTRAILDLICIRTRTKCWTRFFVHAGQKEKWGQMIELNQLQSSRRLVLISLGWIPIATCDLNYAVGRNWKLFLSSYSSLAHIHPKQSSTNFD